MKTLAGLPDSLPGAADNPAKCDECGATTRLGQGPCVNCLLKEGLEAGGEASSEVFESVLAEADVPDKQWRLGNYEILEEIGRGGMGVIYRARQRHSRRIVALKRVLTYHADSHETFVRFRREAEAAASLDHPNVLPIYEVSESDEGLPFFSMKLATGGSLRTAESALRSHPRECVRLMAKVARAIEYAHAEGILHRDLQPGNVLLDGRGEPMVSDFGLAKWLDENSDLTRTLTTFGTPGYIAPEQAECAAADLTPAADIYSLGAILFHLLAGRPPFVGANVLSVIHQAAVTPAPRLRALAPSLDRDLETILARSLERDPQARYQSAGALAEDLERWLDGRPILARRVLVPARMWRWARRNPILAGAATACLLLTAAVIWLLLGQVAHAPGLPAPEKSVAVLPFANLSANPDNAYFTDGVQEEVLTRLSKVAALKVISRTSTQRFAGPPGNSRKIAQQLGVANLLEGSVQRTADQVRVTVRLTDAMKDQHLWAETYDRKLSDIFQVETEIARDIADRLEAKLTHWEANAVAAPPTTNSTAYELYLRARYFLNKRNVEGFRKALDLFAQATNLDPNFARAYAGIADTYGRMPTYDMSSAKECLPLAKAAALKAVELDGGLAEAHTAYAAVLCSEYRYTEARGHLQRAIELDPNDAIAHQLLGLEILLNMGEFDRGLAEVRRAQELDPLSLISNTLVGMAYYRLREYDPAVAQLRKTLELDPNFYLARQVLAQTLDMQGRFDGAINECRKALETSDSPGILATLGHAYARQGNRNDALNVLEQLKLQSEKRFVAAVNFAWVWVGLGEKEEALIWLEKGYDDGSLYGIKMDPFFDPLRGEARFEQLIARVFSAAKSTPPMAVAIPAKSIAVLPFENLSDDKQNAYFAAGVQDEVLSNLARIADLKVISRTSVMQYKSGAARNLRAIGQALGVAHVLEGSVQRVANRVRVNAQLIDARTDAHLWGETYDRDLADVFSIQSEIARTIADQLQAKISPREKTAIAQPPTTDLIASDLYVQALELESKPPEHENLLKAVRLLEQAVERDPRFVLACCALSRMHLTLYFGGYDHTEARRDLAHSAIENAARVQPDAGEVHLAQARYYYGGFRDYDRARAELDFARRTLPNDPQIYSMTAAIDRRQGRFSEALRNCERAVELDPRNVECLMNAGYTYEGLRRYPEAERMFDRAVALAPHDYFVRIARASQPLEQRADVRPLRAELDAIMAEQPGAAPTIAEQLFYCAILERDSAAVDRALAIIPPQGISPGNNFINPRQWFVGLAARTFNDPATARTALTAARAILEKTVREQPDYAPAWGLLGRIDAGLGRKEDAITEGRRACELLPVSADAWIPGSVRNLAWGICLDGRQRSGARTTGVSST